MHQKKKQTNKQKTNKLGPKHTPNKHSLVQGKLLDHLLMLMAAVVHSLEDKEKHRNFFLKMVNINTVGKLLIMTSLKSQPRHVQMSMKVQASDCN